MLHHGGTSWLRSGLRSSVEVLGFQGKHFILNFPELPLPHFLKENQKICCSNFLLSCWPALSSHVKTESCWTAGGIVNLKCDVWGHVLMLLTFKTRPWEHFRFISWIYLFIIFCFRSYSSFHSMLHVVQLWK